YLRLLERVLERNFPDHRAEGLRTAADLEHSFGPAYIRGLLLRGGMASEAIVGVSAEENATTIDGALTIALLWLDHCREHPSSRPRSTSQASRHVGGLRLILPRGDGPADNWRRTAE